MSTTSRRNFLKNGTIGAIAAGVSLGITKKHAVAGMASSEQPLLPDMAAFKAHLKTDFLIGRSKVAVRLIDVLNVGSKRTVAGTREAFTLTFRGDHRAPLKQETYMIEHNKLGIFSMLLVPVVAKDKESRYYEAVINRLHA